MSTTHANPAVDVPAVHRYLIGLQDDIVQALEGADGGSFARDEWVASKAVVVCHA